MVEKNPLDEQGLTDEELIEKIKDCISRGITIKNSIAEECKMNIGQLTYRLSKLSVKFPELDDQRGQKKLKNKEGYYRIVKGLVEYGFSEREISQMVGRSRDYIRSIIKENNIRGELAKRDIHERIYMPSRQLLYEIFTTATQGNTSIHEIAFELGYDQTKIESALLWLSKRKIWFSQAQLNEFKDVIQKSQAKTSFMQRSLLKTAKKEEEQELDIVLGMDDDFDEEKYKQAKKRISTKHREAYIDYICKNRHTISSILSNNNPLERELFFDDLVDMMDINTNLITQRRIKDLVTISSQICGLEYALRFFRKINSNLFEQDKTEICELLQPIKKDIQNKIIIKEGKILRIQGLDDKQIADYIVKRYKFRVSSTDVFLTLSKEETNVQEDEREQ